jgi:multimeric flavodoxin WrbA
MKHEPKVLAINGSPNKDKGNTALILNPFLEGIKEAGAEVNLYYTEDLTINSCKGDLSCYLRTPGHCIHDDDMTWLLPRINKTDILVIASPVYFYGVTGPMKILLDRMFPPVPSTIVAKARSRRIVLVSNCGQWDMDVFDPLLAQMTAWCGHAGVTFTGSLLRPHGPVLKEMIERGFPVNDVPGAAREAGRQLINEGVISKELLDTISRPLLPKDRYMEMLAQAGLQK